MARAVDEKMPEMQTGKLNNRFNIRVCDICLVAARVYRALLPRFKGRRFEGSARDALKVKKKLPL
jgi:hypothetical protein